MKRIAILAATARELAPIQSVFRLFGRVQYGRLDGLPHHIAQRNELELHAVKTGVGPERAGAAAKAVLPAISPHAIISTGYAGALGPEGPGALLIATAAEDWSLARPLASHPTDPLLLETARAAARSAGVGWSQGTLVTVGSIMWRAAEKQALAQTSGALGVDMESAVIARLAAAQAVPFLAVRAVSDRVTEDLPMDFTLWLSFLGSLRGLGHVLTRPSIVVKLYKLKRDADLASETLRRFFLAFLNSSSEPRSESGGRDMPRMARAALL